MLLGRNEKAPPRLRSGALDSFSGAVLAAFATDIVRLEVDPDYLPATGHGGLEAMGKCDMAVFATGVALDHAADGVFGAWFVCAYFHRLRCRNVGMSCMQNRLAGQSYKLLLK